jgi:hypothetical protein
MQPNVNPETGIAYGYISAQSLDQDLVHNLMYDYGKDLSYQSALEEAKAARRGQEAEEEFDEDKFSEEYEAYEPTIAGECDGVKYQTSWLGGALNFFIFFSPVTGSYAACSPCVPGAGNLNQRGSSVTCYDVPRDWMRDD